MSTDTYINFNFHGNEAVNIIAEKLASAPTGSLGRYYFDTTLNALGFYNGTVWVYVSANSVQSVTAGDATIVVDNTDPANPTIVVSIPDLIDDTQSTISNIYSAAKVDAQITAAVTGLWDDRGNYDASGNTYPATGGSGIAGAILKGDIWLVSVAGTLGGSAVNVGDTVRALVDAPAQISSNWALGENNIGYVPEDQANKTDDVLTNATSSVKYTSTKAVYDFITRVKFDFVIADFTAGVLTIPYASHNVEKVGSVHVQDTSNNVVISTVINPATDDVTIYGPFDGFALISK